MRETITVAVLSLPLLLSASEVTLVKDIDPPDTDVGGRLLTRAGNQLFFLSGEGDLWVSDGSAGGTRLVKEFGPFDIDPEETAFVAVGANIFFTADTDAAGVELWRSDGTPGGTFMVKDIAPGTDSAFSLGFGFQVFDVLPLGNAVYFIADDGEHGPELWTSDGTAAGTTLVAETVPGPEGAYYGQQMLGQLGSELYFRSWAGDLWKTDGTTTGTVNLKAFEGGTGVSDGTKFIVAGGAGFFIADTGAGDELWATRGTEATTVLVKDINPGPDSAFLNGFDEWVDMLALGDRLFFFADDGIHGTEFWSSDGTSAGTTLVRDVDATNSGAFSGPRRRLTALGSTLFFLSHSGDLWKSDGTAAGTVLVKDMFAAGAYIDWDDTTFLAFGGKLYFTAYTENAGEELWFSDGTTAGTRMVCDLNPASGDAFLYSFFSEEPVQMAEMGGALYFFGKDPAAGDELRRLGSPSPARLPDMGIARGTGGNLLMTFTAPEAGSYRLERSTGLSAWDPVETRTATAQQVLNFTAPASGTALRYYRVSKL